jgi:DNA-binding IclR family transcriptional regulator
MPELVRELRASDAAVTAALDGLHREGLVAKGGDDRYCFAPAAELLEELTVALAQAYAERPVAVINAIVSIDTKLETLANAFRLIPPTS